MIKCGLTKTLECFGLCLDWILSVVCKCSKNQIIPPTLILLPLDPNPCPMIMPCVQNIKIISYKNNLAKQYFQKLVFQKLDLRRKYLIKGSKNLSKNIFDSYQIQDTQKPQKCIFKSYFPILFKGFFLSPDMVFNRLKLF